MSKPLRGADYARDHFVCKTQSLIDQNIDCSGPEQRHDSNRAPVEAHVRLFSSKSMRYLLPVGLFLTWLGISFAQVRRVDDAALKNAAKSASDGDWLTYGLTPPARKFLP
jgi:hypothetical protein